ncbi:unnamed protein product, partial [marine sediment metagenome]
ADVEFRWWYPYRLALGAADGLPAAGFDKFVVRP